MDYEKFGIYITVIVLVSLCGVAAIGSGEFDVGITDWKGDFKLPTINAGTNTNNIPQDGFYDYCYRMGLDC